MRESWGPCLLYLIPKANDDIIQDMMGLLQLKNDALGGIYL